MKLATFSLWFSLAVLVFATFALVYTEAYADHTPETSQYPRTTPPITLNNGESGIQVKYWHPTIPQQVKINNILDMIKSFQSNPWFVLAYADTIQIETTFPVVSIQCEEVLDEQVPRGHCTFRGQGGFIGGDDKSYSWDPVDKEYKLTDDLIKEAKELLKTIQAQNTPELTPTEKTIIQYKKGEITPLEADFIRLLEKERSVCLVDVLTIQTYGELLVPVDQFVDANGDISLQLVRNFIQGAFDMNRHHLAGDVLRDIEFCRGQQALEYMTGPQYEHMVVDDELTLQFSHRDAAVNIEPHKTQQLTPDDFRTTQNTATKAICESDYYAQNLKKSYGCDPVVEYHTSDVVKYRSTAMDAYERYLEFGDSEQLAELRQKSLSDKLRSLYN